MARIAGVDIPNAKRIEIALTYIYGIGRKSANDILAKTGINPDTRAKDLTEAEIANLWGRVLEKLKSRVEDHNIFINFFEPTYVHDINNNVMTIVVPGALAKGLIEKKYLEKGIKSS